MELAPDCRLSYDEYWGAKRKGTTQGALLRDLLGYTPQQVQAFHLNWMALVEDPVRLQLDIPFDGVPRYLEMLANGRRLYLVTARQHPDRVRLQLDGFGWNGFFSDILVTQQRLSKAALIRSRVSFARADVLVGDTGDDIRAGKELGVRTIAVSSGMLDADLLRNLNPDQLLNSVVEFDAAG